MILKYSSWLKNSYVAVLRYCFGNSSITPAEYLYNRDSKLNKISIYRGFPRRVELYPALVIEADASNASVTFLGDEQYKEIRDHETQALIGVKYVGSLTIPIRITVMARTITDMERLTDFCAIYLRYLFRNKFAEYGFAYTKIEIGGDAQGEADNEPIFTKTLTVNNYTEYESTIPGNTFTDIQAINLNMLVEDIEIADSGSN